MKYGNRSIWRKFVASPFAAIALAVLAFVLVRANINIYDKSETSAVRLEQARIGLDKLIKREQNMLKKVGYLSTDQGIETEMRTRYHAVKDGESVAVIIEDEHAAAVSNALPNHATSTEGWFVRLLHWVGL